MSATGYWFAVRRMRHLSTNSGHSLTPSLEEYALEVPRAASSAQEANDWDSDVYIEQTLPRTPEPVVRK
jgi:hypothetical protein